MRNATVVLAIVLAFPFGYLAADQERTVDRHGDRSKVSRARGAAPAQTVPSPLPLRPPLPLESRFAGTMSAKIDVRSLLLAGLKADAETAMVLLQRALRIGVPSTPENDRLLARVHARLGDLHADRPTKQVVLYAVALRHATDPEQRNHLEKAIEGLGGDVFALTFDSTPARRDLAPEDVGADDVCEGALVVPVDVGAPYSEVMSIIPAGDHNWRTFQNPGLDGWAVRIETISDRPGEFDDDTDLGLWNGCPDAGGQLVAFSDDRPGDFTSLIETDCVLGAGSFYVEVGGFFDSATPDDFTLEIEVTGTCEVPGPDVFEPDDVIDQAATIGYPTSTPPHVNSWGRARREIQRHTLYPPGDVDNVRFRLTREELVRMSTRKQHPTFFNDFATVPEEDHPDTFMELRYETTPDYGGRCNQPDDNFLPVCFSDADCPQPLNNPLPGFPACIPLSSLNVPDVEDRPLATSDDRSAVDLGSELLLCLPRTTPGSPAGYQGGDWIVRVSPFAEGDVFPYEVSVKNEVACRYESEPNGDVTAPNFIELGETIHGVYDFVVTNPFADDDWFAFDVEETSIIRFETLGYDPFVVDTALELAVGPDDNGDYFFGAQCDDDGGQGFLSKLFVILPPANELLDNQVADADYLINVTSFFYNPNFPYTLVSTIEPLPKPETEPNDTCASANTIGVGERVTALIHPQCDYDAFKFSLDESTFMTLSSPAGGDSAIELRDCADDTVLACDDDGGPGLLPLIDGCLPAGEYCARVRAFSGAAAFHYDLKLEGIAGCAPTDPPSLSGDGGFTCLDFDSCP